MFSNMAEQGDNCENIRTPSPKKQTRKARKPKTPSSLDRTDTIPALNDTDHLIERRVNDLCATLHQCVQIWETTTQTTFQTLTSLNSLYTQLRESEDQELGKFLPDGCFAKYRAKLLHLRESLFQDLNGGIEKFEDLQRKFGNSTQSLQVCYLMDLEKVEQGTELAAPLHVDLSSSVEDFCSLVRHSKSFFLFRASKKIDITYQRELDLKRYIGEQFRIAFSTKSDFSRQLSLYTAVWLHQPYITNDVLRTLDSMLIEIGLKTE